VPTVSGFRDIDTWVEHFDEHRVELEVATKEEYLARAKLLLELDLTTRPDILECIRSNGDVCRLNTTTDEYAVCTQLGVLRTYFKADPEIHGFVSNLAYFYNKC
jgi:hypothetical protein